MNILVTGSEGAIGKCLISELKKQLTPINIIRIGKSYNTNCGASEIYLQGDLRKLSTYQKVFSQHPVDMVIACAGQWNGINKDQAIFENNILLFSGLISYLPESVKKVVFISSSAVYTKHQSDNLELIDVPQNSYGASKFFSEKLLIEASNRGSFKYTIYRPFHVVSPFEKYKKGSSHVCTDFCHRIIEKGEDLLNDEQLKHVYVGFMWAIDFANILVKNLLVSSSNNEIYNVGVEEEHSLAELAYCITRVALKRKLVSKTVLPERKFAIRCRQDGCFVKLRSIKGHHKNLSFRSMVEEFIERKYLGKKYEI